MRSVGMRTKEDSFMKGHFVEKGLTLREVLLAQSVFRDGKPHHVFYVARLEKKRRRGR